MADLTTLQARLDEAESALHDLTLGAQRVVMERNGTKIQYTPANIPALKAYVATLQAQIRAAGGAVPGVQTARRGILYNQF